MNEEKPSSLEEKVKEKSDTSAEESGQDKTTYLDDLIDSNTNKNKKKVKCIRCDSYILQPNSCTFMRTETHFEVPSMMQKKDLASNNNKINTDNINEFWLINDMLTFENVGFTNMVDDKKYLICADCEIGPIGFQKVNTNQFYVCLNRVKYV